MEQERPRPRLITGTLTFLAAIVALAVTALMVAALLQAYYWQADEYRDSHRLVEGDALTVFQLIFYIIVAISIPLATLLAAISASLMRISKIGAVAVTLFALGLFSDPILRVLSFSNTCTLGVSFPFPSNC